MNGDGTADWRLYPAAWPSVSRPQSKYMATQAQDHRVGEAEAAAAVGLAGAREIARVAHRSGA